MNVEKSKANTGHNLGKEIIYQVLGQKLLPSTPFNGERLVFHPNSGCLLFLTALFSFQILPKAAH